MKSRDRSPELTTYPQPSLLPLKRSNIGVAVSVVVSALGSGAISGSLAPTTRVDNIPTPS